ncbi:MAG: anti-sigma factor [Firmicutes bacterium]|nr:anti-sigma factor [Bacillota bacterium]
MELTPCKQFEIEMVDEILGNLPPHRAQILHDHLAGCRSCQKLYEEWRKILHEVLADELNNEPSAFLYKRLKKTYRLWSIKRRLFKPATFWKAASVAVISILIFALSSIQSKKPLESWKQLPIASENIPSFVINDVNTMEYHINYNKDQCPRVSGIIWINNDRDEVYCFMQNLKNYAENDYQLWLIKPFRRENGGLLQLMDEYGELYLRQRNIQEVQQISISLEPKGGSLYPTTDDIILLDFSPE